MKRKDKIEKKIKRAKLRREKRNQKYFSRISEARNIDYNVPLSAITKWGTQSWPDSSSPTGYSQVCSYKGICQSPCNGDC